ncbi:MAG: DotI/IcmL family type IV secretion protein [Proteobacteria bacterium]|nr:DotI/IcmL family type IV secretion protein [Pseudomonadota bacterium]
MKKLLVLTGLFCVALPLFADTADDIANIQMRLKQIEVRLGLIERDVGDLKSSSNASSSVPLSQSNLPSSQVLIWASESIEQIYSYNYKNFPQVLSGIRQYFTAQGYDSYIKALNDSNNLQIVQDKRLYVTGKVKEKGKIVSESAASGIYTWELQIPIEVNYKSSSESVNQNLIANVEIVRVPLSDSQVGIAIHSIKATVAGQGKTAPTVPTTK